MKLKLLPIFLLLLSSGNAQQIDIQTRDNAGEFGANVKSGFFQTSSPVNFPVGAAFGQWWHLLDVRHNNPINNYTMQLATSFENANGKYLWFRKTSNDASAPWNKLLMEDSSGRSGIGGDAGYDRLTITGGHSNSNILLHAHNGTNAHAYLTLWASEPASSWTGVGIGNNVRGNYNNVPFQRIDTNRGGSYMRFLDNEIYFNVVERDGNTKIPLILAGNGQANFPYAVSSPSIISSASNPEGGSITLGNESKTGDAANVWKIYNMTGGYGNSLQFWSYSQNSMGPKLKLADNGDIAVYGKFEAKEIKVTTTPTADFVFEDNYQLPSLESVEKHIKEKKHLPEIASAKEMEKEGVNIGEFQIKLLQKIEELTLYTIEQNRLLKEQNAINREQSEKIKNLESRLNSK